MDAAEGNRVKKGLIHIYEGNGQGKTSAAVGLAVRCAGNGKKVVFSQFLKTGTSGELAAMAMLPNIVVHSTEKSFGFTFRMDEETKVTAAAYYAAHFREAVRLAEEEQADMLVLDELIDAMNAEMADQEEVLDFLRSKPEGLEVVLTGRNPAPEIADCADYYTYFEKRKHPYDRGILARKGIEY